MARRRTPADDLLGIASKLPWWLALLLAVVFYFVLHAIASKPVVPSPDMKDVGKMVSGQLIHTFAFIGQFALPFIFVMGAIASFFGKMKRERLHEQVQARGEVSSIMELSWRDFERLVSEAFRRRGYSVVENVGAGPDGGVDLVLTKSGEKFVVQCKRWKATIVGVDVVRELFGVMSARGAVGGFVVTSGKFSADARAFAEGRNIDLIAGDELLHMIRAVEKGEAAPTAIPQSIPIPTCPACNGTMIRRTAKRDSNAGQSFWGCSSYPRCKGTRPIG